MTPRRDRIHETHVITLPQGCVWECSCGDYNRVPAVYRVASAGAERHRRHMRLAKRPRL